MQYEFEIAPTGSKKDYLKILDAIVRCGGKVRDDASLLKAQLEPWWEQMYTEFELHGEVVMLHYEHYLGLFLLSENVKVNELARIWASVQECL